MKWLRRFIFGEWTCPKCGQERRHEEKGKFFSYRTPRPMICAACWGEERALRTPEPDGSIFISHNPVAALKPRKAAPAPQWPSYLW